MAQTAGPNAKFNNKPPNRPNNSTSGPPQQAARRAVPKWVATGANANAPNLNPNQEIAPPTLANIVASGPPPSTPSNGLSTTAPPLDSAAKAMQDRFTLLLMSLVGSRVTVTSTNGQKFDGILGLPSTSDGELQITLKRVTVTTPDATSMHPSVTLPHKDVIDIQAMAVDLDARTTSITTAPSAKSGAGDSFRTDTEITGLGASANGRELQKWDSDLLSEPLESMTLGGGGGGRGWDQFGVNEKLFGSQTNYNEEMYTTKLNRNRPDYKAMERKANQLAKEIESGVVANSHVAEERNLIQAEEVDEEDRYGAVIRNPINLNIYRPPGARAAQVAQQPPAKPTDATVPAAASSANSTAPAAAREAPAATKPAISAPNGTAAETSAPGKVVSDFKSFVSNEKERLTARKQNIAKKEKDTKLSELLRFSQTFKLNYPVPPDLVPLLAKDEEKQKEIVSKASSPEDGAAPTKLSAAALAAHTAATSASKKAEATKSKRIHMEISQIPPFNPNKSRAAPSSTPDANIAASAAAPSAGMAAIAPVPEKVPSTSSKINPAAPAFVFRPNPNALAFTPGITAPASNAPSPSRKPIELAPPANPYFGDQTPSKGSASMQVKEDFTPFKHANVPFASTIAPTWSFTGKSFRHMASAVTMPSPEKDAPPSLPQLPPPPMSLPMPPAHSVSPQPSSVDPTGGIRSPPPHGPPVPYPLPYQAYPAQYRYPGQPPQQPGQIPGMPPIHFAPQYMAQLAGYQQLQGVPNSVYSAQLAAMSGAPYGFLPPGVRAMPQPQPSGPPLGANGQPGSNPLPSMGQIPMGMAPAVSGMQLPPNYALMSAGQAPPAGFRRMSSTQNPHFIPMPMHAGGQASEG